MPLQATSGAASYDAFGGGVPVVPNYIEEVFGNYLYTGNGSTQTITNGIDLSGKGGMVWLKSRQAVSHALFTTAQGAGTEFLSSNRTDTIADATALTSFNTTGFTLGAGASGWTNTSPQPYVSWTFRKQPKFFDVVTWTGDGTANRAIPHNLGSQPGFITCKKTSGADAWQTAHRGNGTTGIYGFVLNDSAQGYSWSDYNTYITSTVFYPDQLAGFMNTNGQTYVAYLFAHNAGGFGLTGTDNVITCGSYTGSGGVDTVTLGYEPQWILMKGTNAPGLPWLMFDNMRGLSYTNNAQLDPSTSAAESSTSAYVRPTATGFTVQPGFYGTGADVIYIAIRRGPMKVPTSGTSVYNNLANRVGTSATATISGVGFPVDLMLPFNETSGSSKPFVDRLRGATKYLLPPYSNAEQTNTDVVTSFASNDGVIVGADASLQVINNYYNADRRYAASFFRRAPSVFDIVCYTGTGSTQNITHNLGAVPELMIVKIRNSAATANWGVYHQALGNTEWLKLNLTDAVATNVNMWNSTTPTSSVFSIGTAGTTNTSSGTYVAYLFATCAGVSKVGSYTGTGALQTVNCGFTSGARFIIIKRTDSTGDWYMYDSARGISASSDPYLILNTTGTSELGTNYVDTDSTGFKVTAAAPAALNANGGSFIFLAIA